MLNMDSQKDSISPSEETLRRVEEFNYWLANARDESTTPTKKVTASFNLEALKIAASAVIGKGCSGVFLIAQGGFNQVFVLTFPDGLEIIARLNRSNTDQDKNQPVELLEHRVASEAATIKLIRAKTTIPVPKIYAVETRTDNPVGARYILEERIQGRNLGIEWQTMSSTQRDLFMTQIAEFETQLLKIRFDRIGSIVEDPFTGAFSVGRLGLSCVGPYNLIDDVGPWSSSHDFIRAYIEAKVDLLENHPDVWIRERIKYRAINKDPDAPPLEYLREWFRLFAEGFRRLTSTYPPPDEPCPDAPFVLHHPDLNLGNILVAYDDYARIVGIIDWEGTRVGPLWSSVQPFRPLEVFKGEEHSRLEDIRNQILITQEPAIIMARERSLVLRDIAYIVTTHAAVCMSIGWLNKMFTRDVQRWPVTDAEAFQELIEYIQSHD